MPNIDTFWKIISDYSIVIPQIQRDYAQGRSDDVAAEIRKNILNHFYTAISIPETTDIDFIYGEVNDNNEFIPLDGQQRLTTLFLIHLYLAKQGDVDEDKSSFLRRFRYETRQSSTDFCRALMNAELYFADDKVIENIKDQRWFYHAWKKDPTITAMLTMLQDIHLKFKECDHADFFDRLISDKNPPITFNFLPTKKFGLTDDLYVKMNSRGKLLTRFENFKVWFEKKYPNNRDWQNKIDNDWTNLFWNFKDAFHTVNKDDDNSIDDEFMQFFNGMLIFSLALNGNKNEAQNFSFASEIPLSKYKELLCFSEDEVDKITLTLDWFCEQYTNLESMLSGIDFWKDTTIFKKFISSQATYEDRVQFYIIFHYIYQSRENNFTFDIVRFRSWMRVMRNLIENTRIDSVERFTSALLAINNIGKNCNKIYHYLANEENKISYFFQAQLTEERIKARLILSDFQWENELLKAENHMLFRACISFLLYDKDKQDIEIFKKFSTIAANIFSNDGTIPQFKKNCLLIRSMLCCGNFGNSITLEDTGSTWRYLLKRNDVQYAMHKILETFARSKVEFYSQILDSIIYNFNDRNVLWKYYLIKNSVLLNRATNSGNIQEYGSGFIYLYKASRWNSAYDNNILISNLRNEIISKLIEINPEITLEHSDSYYVFKDKTTSLLFYRGWDIWLKKSVFKSGASYKLWLEFLPDQLTIGVHKDDTELIEIAPNNLERDNTWLVCKRYSFIKINTPEQIEPWLKNVLNDLPAIETIASPKIL